VLERGGSDPLDRPPSRQRTGSAVPRRLRSRVAGVSYSARTRDEYRCAAVHLGPWAVLRDPPWGRGLPHQPTTKRSRRASGGPEERAVPRVHPRQIRPRVHHERPQDLHPLVEAAERLDDVGGDPILEHGAWLVCAPHWPVEPHGGRTALAPLLLGVFLDRRDVPTAPARRRGPRRDLGRDGGGRRTGIGPRPRAGGGLSVTRVLPGEACGVGRPLARRPLCRDGRPTRTRPSPRRRPPQWGWE